MPECPRCRTVFLAGESHDCRDFHDGRRRAVDTALGTILGGAIVAMGLAAAGFVSITISLSGVALLAALGWWRWRHTR